jgi:riboflavin kinase/FMN adenylyltransferase
VHRGHQALLQGLRKEGRRGLPVVVMIFEPHRWSCLRAINRPPA